MKLTVKQWRQIKELNQKEMADKLKMKFSTYQSKESGLRPWKADEIKNIAQFLGISIETQLEY
jgi:transcriptional regulator with XRE-family HTH domain